MLDELAQSISSVLGEHDYAELIFICTHNSRRSHLSQIWASIAAQYFDKKVICYSGGTESTAVYKSILGSLSSAGIEISHLTEGENPVYSLRYASSCYPLIAFSKSFDYPSNPQLNFGAIMTCGHAEENCPFIPEALFRFPLTYIDPKHSDGTAEESEVYASTCQLIATEVFYLFSRL